MSAGDEAIPNRAFFDRLYIYAGRVIDHEMKEPFNILTEAYRVQQGRDAGVSPRSKAASDRMATEREPHVGSPALALGGQVWNKMSM
jgi:hypothetical protein